MGLTRVALVNPSRRGTLAGDRVLHHARADLIQQADRGLGLRWSRQWQRSDRLTPAILPEQESLHPLPAV